MSEGTFSHVAAYMFFFVICLINNGFVYEILY